MKSKSLSLFEFNERYRTEKHCLQAIEKQKWTKGFVCRKCGHRGGYKLRTRRRVIECTECKHQSSITAGTLFHRTRIPLRKWF